MRRRGWLTIVGLIAVGAFMGAAAVVTSVAVNRHTSTDTFCSSCHSMGHLATDPVFIKSAHRANAVGVLPSCGDCHIPKTNWFVETYTHVLSGVRDIIAEYSNDFNDPSAWERRRIELAHYVRDVMRSNDSVTCRNCHTAAAIQPTTERGRAAHALLAEGRMTCIDCHINLVHAPVPPSDAFLRGSRLRLQGK